MSLLSGSVGEVYGDKLLTFQGLRGSFGGILKINRRPGIIDLMSQNPLLCAKIAKSMNKAAQLSKKLEEVDITEGTQLIEQSNMDALYFDIIGEAMCIMHDDGSVNIIENIGGGVVTTEVISAENILKVLQHYRPFKEVFKGSTQ